MRIIFTCITHIRKPSLINRQDCEIFLAYHVHLRLIMELGYNGAQMAFK